MLNLKIPLFFVLLLLFFSACVTVHVEFPAAQAEHAAGQIVTNVHGSTPAATGFRAMGTTMCAPEIVDAPQPTTESKLAPASYHLAYWLEILIPTASAEESMKISPKVETLQSNMAKRYQKLEPCYKTGAIGLTNDGFIALRDDTQVPPESLNNLKTLVDKENHDRSELYREIAIANGHPEWEKKMGEIFAKRWTQNALTGWWYQDQDAQWQRKQ